MRGREVGDPLPRRVDIRQQPNEAQPTDADLEAGLLSRLSGRGVLRGLMALHAPAGQHPAGAEIAGAHREISARRVPNQDVRTLDAPVSAREEVRELDDAADEKARDLRRADAP